MRVSINLTRYWPSGSLAPQLAALVASADAVGVDTVWVADHVIQADPSASPEEAVLEAFTVLGFLAGAGTRVRLGTMVTPAATRPPAVIVKAVTTLDVLSAGRAWLGIGAGYHRQEAEWMGLPFPPTAERFDRLEDTVRLALQMWSGDESPFQGAQCRLARPISSPPPVSRPFPPILIGGMGERRTIPLVARYADACNFFDVPDGGATLARKLSLLERACQEADRSFDKIQKTVSARFGPAESPPAFAERCRALGRLGFGHVVVITDGPWIASRLTALGGVIAELGAA